MSFASEVKKEILSNEDISICCKKALLFGILQGTSEITIGRGGVKLKIKSSILNVIKTIISCLKDEYEINIENSLQLAKNSLGNKYYYLEIKDKVSEIIEEYSLMPYDEIDLDHPLLKNECCKNSFVRGLFAAKGSINDPRKECYHCEISCKKESVANAIMTIFHLKGIESKLIMKYSNYLVYIKKSENISNALALIGANSGVFYFEDSRIYRDFIITANRLANCDVANARRSASSCEKQLAIIQLIREYGYFEKMPVRLQSIAKMREDYPDSSLEELSEFSDKMFGKRLSKSGISHCLRDLESYYNSLKISEKE